MTEYNPSISVAADLPMYRHLEYGLDVGAIADGVVEAYEHGGRLPDDAESQWQGIRDGAVSLGSHHAAPIPGSAMYRYNLGNSLGATVMPLQGAKITGSLDGSRPDRYIGGMVEMTVDALDDDFIGGARPVAMLAAARTVEGGANISGLLFHKMEDGVLIGEVADQLRTRKMAKMLIALLDRPDLTKPESVRAVNIRKEYDRR